MPPTSPPCRPPTADLTTVLHTFPLIFAFTELRSSVTQVDNTQDREKLSSYLMRAEFYFDSNIIKTDQVGEKAGVVLLDLTAAYDTVWHRGLHLKLLQLIPERHIVNFIMEMLRNRRFTLHTSDGQRSRPRRLKNGVPQGSVLAPCYSTPTSMISQRHSLRSTDTQTTWLSYSMTSNGRRLKQDSRQT